MAIDSMVTKDPKQLKSHNKECIHHRVGEKLFQEPALIFITTIIKLLKDY